MNESNKSLFIKLRKRFSNKPKHLEPRSDMDWTENPLTSGGKPFREWLKNRINEDMNPANLPKQVSKVTTPVSPQDAKRRQEVGQITTGMMTKNPKLIPGKIKNPSEVLNAIKNDSQLSKMDVKTQQDVTNFFLNPSPD